MKFKNLVLTLGVLMMLAFTSMAAAAPSQVNRSMTAINAAKAEIPAVCELVGYNVDGDTSIITFKDPNTLERYVVDVNTATAKVQEIEVKGATFVMGSTMVTKTPDEGSMKIDTALVISSNACINIIKTLFLKQVQKAAVKFFANTAVLGFRGQIY